MATCLAAGCVTPPLEPRATLDPRTGVSLTVVDQPLVLARERRDVAVQARDYLTLVAAEINESGRRRLVWAVHQWSTIDSRATESRPTPGAPLLLIADGRDMRLIPLSEGPFSAYTGNPALLPPDDADVTTTLYPADTGMLDFIAASHDVAATFPESRLNLPYVLWRDGRPAIRRLLQQLDGHPAK